MRYTIIKLLKILGPLNLVFGTPALICLCVFGLFALGSIVDFVSGRTDTSPLPPQIQADLCAKFSLSPKERLCASDNVLARDFYPIIFDTFLPGQTSFEEVDAILGSYEWQKSELELRSDERNFYWVSYDLRGDEAFWIVFYFYEHGTMFRMREGYKDD